VRWVNPFSNVVHLVSLRPEDVMAIVFWSKNYLPLAPHLDELDASGYKMLFHFTITGLPRIFESRVPDAEEMVKCARMLSERYGSDAVLWRYDPILISTITDRDYHLNRFTQLCADLEGITKRCYFSFTVFYQKVKKNADALRRETNIACYSLSMEDRIDMAGNLADIASNYGIEILSCCCDYLVGGKIKKAHCLDAELLYRLYPEKIGRLSKLPTRNECGCCAATDIGAYDTCPHGCLYCYANANKAVARAAYQRHDPESAFLGFGKSQSDDWVAEFRQDGSGQEANSPSLFP